MKNIFRCCSLLVLFVFTASAADAQIINYDSLVQALPKEKSDAIYSLTEKSEAMQSRGETDSAIMANQIITSILPNFAPAYVTIAGLYGSKLQFRDEIVWANRAIAADSNYINGYINLGNAYASMRSYDTATRIYMTASFVDPQSPVPAYSLGVLLEEQGEFNAALKNYLQSARIDTMFEPAVYNAAMMYANLKKYPEAKAMLRHALRISPYDKDVETEYKAIEKEEKEAGEKKKK